MCSLLVANKDEYLLGNYITMGSISVVPVDRDQENIWKIQYPTKQLDLDRVKRVKSARAPATTGTNRS